MPYTAGFDPLKLSDHFQKHGARLGVVMQIQYEMEADRFLGGPKRITTLECKRIQGDIVRYDFLSKRFGVLSSSGVIHTYYKPDRAVHGKLFHICYFKCECNRVI